MPARAATLEELEARHARANHATRVNIRNQARKRAAALGVPVPAWAAVCQIREARRKRYVAPAGMSKREARAMKLFVSGKSLGRIAEALGASELETYWWLEDPKPGSFQDE